MGPIGSPPEGLLDLVQDGRIEQPMRGLEELGVEKGDGLALPGFGGRLIDITGLLDAMRRLVYTANIFQHVAHIAAKLRDQLSVHFGQVIVFIALFPCPLRKVWQDTLEVFDAIFACFGVIVAKVFQLRTRVLAKSLLHQTINGG